MFVWDAPAHGLSRPFELSFSMQDIVHYLYTIFQIEHIVMPIFVGQSLGGYIAQVYITEYPNTTLVRTPSRMALSSLGVGTSLAK